MLPLFYLIGIVYCISKFSGFFHAIDTIQDEEAETYKRKMVEDYVDNELNAFNHADTQGKIKNLKR